MFPKDTADFYRIFLHIKQIIRPSELQPYIKKQENVLIVTILCSKGNSGIDTKFFELAITIAQGSMLSALVVHLISSAIVVVYWHPSDVYLYE